MEGEAESDLSNITSVSQDDHVPWSEEEINALLQSWSTNANLINQPRNENAMAIIAADVGTSKNAKQVRNKLKKMRSRFILEKEKAMKGYPSRWRYFERMRSFQDLIIKNPNRRPAIGSGGDSTPTPVKTATKLFGVPTSYKKTSHRSDSLLGNTGSKTGGSGDISLSAMTKLLTALRPLPASQDAPVNMFDPDIPDDVAISEEWKSWNEHLRYPLTDSGIRCLLRCGFSHITHLNLLKGEGTKLSLLSLNYHDQLALRHALEMDAKKPQQIQLISSDGTVVELQSYNEQDQTALLSSNGIKMAEWNKDLPIPLSSRALTAVLTAGFQTASELTKLIKDEDIEKMQLSMRDKAILRDVIATGGATVTDKSTSVVTVIPTPSTSSDAGKESAEMDTTPASVTN